MGLLRLRRIVAIDAIVRIDGDEYRALCVNGEVLIPQKREQPLPGWCHLKN
jgi:hypothetical protein